MKKRSGKTGKDVFFIALRYLVLLVLVFTLPLIYRILTPLTIYPVVFILKLFFNSVSVSQNLVDGEQISMLIINSKIFIQIIPACIAGSAYLLLLIINLTVEMSVRKRIYSVLVSLGLLFGFNIIRIVFFSVLYYNNSVFFDFTHKIFWYLLSTVFVAFIWFLTVKIFSIREIPVYTDIRHLMKGLKKK